MQQRQEPAVALDVGCLMSVDQTPGERAGDEWRCARNPCPLPGRRSMEQGAATLVRAIVVGDIHGCLEEKEGVEVRLQIDPFRQPADMAVFPPDVDDVTRRADGGAPPLQSARDQELGPA